ncbi:hypothetical protein CRV02_08345 [Arcobacter sp. CECT 8989]|uniref:hypothetical protein n=1 Tax=Arcobacter sp. CECT 8989 TaxID=2044509 RepID=UPI00100B4368|nr:hypothetical protein [Arcobacter sp. CECT 8989]RXK01509.1 hypothetical protein CRV02_08345 [Arcobacter sp. CECT 8989]
MSGIGGLPEETYHISVSADSPIVIGSPDIGQGGSGVRSNSIYEKFTALDGLSYLKKINSNVKHKPIKFKYKNTYLKWEGYDGDNNYWYWSKPNFYNHYVYLLQGFKGLEYKIDKYTDLDENMPFYKQNPQLTQASKSFIQSVSYYANRGAYDLEYYKAKYGDKDFRETHKNLAYSSIDEWRNEIKENIQEMILSHARSALKAGVPCTTILSEIKENYQIVGLDDEIFLSACREEKGIELGRMYHSKTEESICCIDVEMHPDKFRKQGESFQDYFSRFKNTVQWGNLSLTYDFL